MIVKQSQALELTVATEGIDAPENFVVGLLREHGVTVEVTYSGAAVEVEVVPVVNRERLIKLMTWVAGEDAKQRLGLPSEWSQGHWLAAYNPRGAGLPAGCGTACCVAGKVALEDGGVPVWRGHDTSAEVTFPGNPEQQVYVSGYAAEALGLTEQQASALFSGDNDYDAMLEVAAEILNS